MEAAIGWLMFLFVLIGGIRFLYKLNAPLQAAGSKALVNLIIKSLGG